MRDMKLLSYSELVITSRSDTRPNCIPASKGTLRHILSVKLLTTQIWDINIGNWIAQTIGLNIYDSKEDAIFSSVEIKS